MGDFGLGLPGGCDRVVGFVCNPTVCADGGSHVVWLFQVDLVGGHRRVQLLVFVLPEFLPISCIATPFVHVLKFGGLSDRGNG